MAHKYRVKLSKPGYGWHTHYAFFADSIKWRTNDSIYVTAGAARWPIPNIIELTDVTTGRPVSIRGLEGAPKTKVKAEPLKAKTEPRTLISKAERRLLHRLLSCHVTGQVLKDTGLKDLQLRLKEEFGMSGGMELVRPKGGYQQVLS